MHPRVGHWKILAFIVLSVFLRWTGLGPKNPWRSYYFGSSIVLIDLFSCSRPIVLGHNTASHQVPAAAAPRDRQAGSCWARRGCPPTGTHHFSERMLYTSALRAASASRRKRIIFFMLWKVPVLYQTPSAIHRYKQKCDSGCELSQKCYSPNSFLCFVKTCTDIYVCLLGVYTDFREACSLMNHIQLLIQPISKWNLKGLI